MKFRPQQYAEALYLSLGGGENDNLILKRFITLVDKFGDRSYLPKIVEEFEKKVVQGSGHDVVTLEFARDPGKDYVQHLSNVLKEGDLHRTKINKDLVAGVRITKNGERELDISLAGRLKKMFII